MYVHICMYMHMHMYMYVCMYYTHILMHIRHASIRVKSVVKHCFKKKERLKSVINPISLLFLSHSPMRGSRVSLSLHPSLPALLTIICQ